MMTGGDVSTRRNVTEVYLFINVGLSVVFILIVDGLLNVNDPTGEKCELQLR